MFFAVIAIALGTWSCGDDPVPVTPGAPKFYFKGMTTIGNYWVYEYSRIDTNGVLLAATGTDSVYVNGINTIGGFQASSIFSFHDEPGDSLDNTDTTNVRVSGDSMFFYLGESSIPGDTVPFGWVLIGNSGAIGEWSIFNRSFKQQLNLGGITANADLVLTARGSRNADTTFTARNSVSYTCTQFSLTPSMTGTITPTGVPIALPLTTSNGIQRRYFADGVGLVMDNQEQQTFKVGSGVPPLGLMLKQDGWKKILLRYYIKP